MPAPPVRAEAAISALPRPLGEEWRNSELHKILKALRQRPGPAASSRQRSLFTEDRAEGGEGRGGQGRGGVVGCWKVGGRGWGSQGLGRGSGRGPLLPPTRSRSSALQTFLEHAS